MLEDFALTRNAYGKAGVRLFKVDRSSDRHEIQEVTVRIRLTGSFDAAYTQGDNSMVLPTDTMKNTVYGLARERPFEEIEEFGIALAEHFAAAAKQALGVRIELEQHIWDRASVGERPHPHAFVKGSAERRLATARCHRMAGGDLSLSVEAGVEDLKVLKTTGSGFVGFPRDRFTTLKETEDRVFATAVSAHWRYGSQDVSYGPTAHGIRQTLIETFAEHQSLSVQHTLDAMGRAVLASYGAVEEIRLVMPNIHYLLADLEPFGLDNPNQIFVATQEPYGVIEGILRR